MNTTPDEYRTIAVEAYTYLYPLLLMDRTVKQLTNVQHAGDAPLRSPIGTFMHVPSFPPGDFKGVVRPNFDTLYSSAFVDLSNGPVVLSVPAAGDLYYLLPMYDMFGEVFASPGTRTIGSDAHTLLLVGPDWGGTTPAEMTMIRSPHELFWIIGRTQASPSTYDEVHEFQAGLKLVPLASWPGPAPDVVGTIDPTVDDVTPPLEQVFALDAQTFFTEATKLLARYPSHLFDQTILLRLRRIGVVEGSVFDWSATSPAQRQQLQSAVTDAQQRITQRQRSLGTEANGWRITAQNMGSYGQDYLQRAVVELIGLGANLPDDAVYPISYVDGDGDPYSGQGQYRLRFAAGEHPPVGAFWSLTLYDDDGFQVPNPLNRFTLGDRDPLVVGDDGSITLYIQAEAPGGALDANWLPAPKGSFNLCLRLYYPAPEVLDGGWVPPAVTKAA